MGRARGLSWEGGPAPHASVFLSRLWRSLEAAKARGTPPPARPPHHPPPDPVFSRNWCCFPPQSAGGTDGCSPLMTPNLDILDSHRGNFMAIKRKTKVSVGIVRKLS